MKQIKLKVVDRGPYHVRFYISHQTKTAERFGAISDGYPHGNGFIATNGCSLVSSIHPEVNDAYDTLYVRGECRSKHKRRMFASADRFQRIKFAVDEYNEHFKGE